MLWQSGFFPVLPSEKSRWERWHPRCLKENVTVQDKQTLSTPLSWGNRTVTNQMGGTLVEAMIGTAIAATGITALCVASADCLGISRAHKEVLVANQCLQQRAEQYRAAGWPQITDANNVQALLAQPTANNGVLDGHTEKITVNAYPPVTPAVTPIVVTRDAAGNTVIVSQPSGYSLRDAVAVEIDFQEAWTSAQGHRTRSFEASTVVALGGIVH